MIAYHFTSDVLRDGRPVPPIGETLVHYGKVIPCQAGLHASVRPSDALNYAPGHMLHRVKLSGEIVEHGGDKVVASGRTILATIDAEHLLRRFAADQALSVAHLWDMPDIVRDYLTTLDESKRAAARDAAWDAAWGAARAAAWGAARDAARDAARAAAWGAAWAAARDAARDAAWAAARDAAWAAARDAAWDAARDAARADFDKRVDAAFAQQERDA